MGKRPRIMGRLVGIFLFGLLLGGPLAETARTQSEAPTVSGGAESGQEADLDRDEVENVGWLTIFFDPCDTILRAPGEILLTDPLRRRVGWVITEAKALFEIEGSFYEDSCIDDDEGGEPVPLSKVLGVKGPVEGKYLLNVIGSATRAYGLIVEIRSAGPDAQFQLASVQDIRIGQGEIHLYEFTYLEKNTKDLALKRVW